jgi:hypothetical protein
MNKEWREFTLGNRPPNGVVVIVEGVVRYGRKLQLMAAKIMEVHDDSYQTTLEWVALKNGSAYSETIKLKKVYQWRHM